MIIKKFKKLLHKIILLFDSIYFRRRTSMLQRAILFKNNNTKV
jgi:exopolysaccharide biosynthesis predicted pyruvyltransferase EpsI